MDTLSYAFNYVPWWVWTVIVVVLLAVFWQALLPIWLALPKWLKGLILAAGALLTAYVAGRNRGSKDERDRQSQRDIRAVQTRKSVDRQIDDMSDEKKDKEWQRWQRD